MSAQSAEESAACPTLGTVHAPAHRGRTAIPTPGTSSSPETRHRLSSGSERWVTCRPAWAARGVTTSPERTVRVNSCWLFGILGAMICGARAHEADAAECPSTDLGLEPGAADTVVFAYETRGYGQVVFVPDTVVKSFTVWRPARPCVCAPSAGHCNWCGCVRHTRRTARTACTDRLLWDYRAMGSIPLSIDLSLIHLILPEAGEVLLRRSHRAVLWWGGVSCREGEPLPGWSSVVHVRESVRLRLPDVSVGLWSRISICMFRVELCRSVTGIRRATWGHIKGIYR